MNYFEGLWHAQSLQGSSDSLQQQRSPYQLFLPASGFQDQVLIVCTAALRQQFLTACSKTCLPLSVLVKWVLPSQAVQNAAAPEEV